MADQGRWFKVWTSILDDPDFQELTLDEIARWVLLGAMTKLVGEHGVLVINGTGRRLCQVLRVDSLADAKTALERLPNVTIHEGKSVYGAFTVTFRNWRKYQEDSTVAERMKTLRAKKRREEKRETTPVVTREVTARARRLPARKPDDLTITQPDRPEPVAAVLARMGFHLAEPEGPAG